MPELPTVDAFRRYLIKENVIGDRIISVDVSWPPSIMLPQKDLFFAKIKGSYVKGIHRRGKWLFIELDKGTLGIHLRMTGSLFVIESSDPEIPYARTKFHLQEGRRLVLSDPRKFAKLWFGTETTEILSQLGPEPLNDSLEPHIDFRFEEFSKHFVNRNIAVKTLLLDQSVVAGIGNIYADEILLRCGLSPLIKTSQLKEAGIRSIYDGIVSVLGEAITELDVLLGQGLLPVGNQESKEHFKLPRFKDAKCQVCGSKVSWMKLNGRGTYYCGSCQK